jgi:WD repeat-containing protein 35
VDKIADELTEYIILGGVRLLVGEWIPFGSNQIVALNERLGSGDRCMGGMFTPALDTDPDSNRLDLPTGLTEVKVLDSHNTRHINLEAIINLPEDEDIVQIENLGMHFNKNGSAIYGMLVESIGARLGHDISIDMLCRVMKDVIDDSSEMVESLISCALTRTTFNTPCCVIEVACRAARRVNQRELLQMTYMGDQLQRTKYVVVMADAIRPKLRAEARPPDRGYLDGEENECELKQILGDVDLAKDLGPHDVVLVGRRGMLLAGPNVKDYDIVVAAFMTLMSIDMFLQVFFIRTFVLGDTLNQTRHRIENRNADPNAIPIIRKQLSETSRNIVMLLEILEYILESCEGMQPPVFPKDVQGIALYGHLEIEERLATLKERAKDMRKNVNGARNELQNLQDMTEVINNAKLEDVISNVEANTKDLVDATAFSERSSTSLEVMQVIAITPARHPDGAGHDGSASASLCHPPPPPALSQHGCTGADHPGRGPGLRAARPDDWPQHEHSGARGLADGHRRELDLQAGRLVLRQLRLVRAGPHRSRQAHELARAAGARFPHDLVED